MPSRFSSRVQIAWMIAKIIIVGGEDLASMHTGKDKMMSDHMRS